MINGCLQENEVLRSDCWRLGEADSRNGRELYPLRVEAVFEIFQINFFKSARFKNRETC